MAEVLPGAMWPTSRFEKEGWPYLLSPKPNSKHCQGHKWPPPKPASAWVTKPIAAAAAAAAFI